MHFHRGRAALFPRRGGPGAPGHQAQPGREAEAEARLLQTVAYVRRVEPSTVYRLHRSSSEPATFLFYETYASQNNLEQHSKVTLPAFRKEYGETPEGLWARPPMIEIFRELAR